jgi:hypothetical protein
VVLRQQLSLLIKDALVPAAMQFNGLNRHGRADRNLDRPPGIVRYAPA